MTGKILVPVIMVCIALAVLLGIWVIKNKIARFSRELFGTDNLVEGIQHQADLAAETPKSVSGMTRLLMPQIGRDFPDFSWAEFKHIAENMLTSALIAITTGKEENLRNVSDSVREQICNRIADNAAGGVSECYQQIRIHQTEIADYRKQKGSCVITIQSAVEYYHYKMRGGQLIEGARERKTQTKYNMELVYIQDSDLAEFDNAIGMSCPNCGAPIRRLGDMQCEYCGTKVTPINTKVWSLHKIYEVNCQRV